MKYRQIERLDEEEFRRLTGVKPTTFNRMLEILIEAHLGKQAKGGRSNKLCLEDQLVIVLEYIRE